MLYWALAVSRRLHSTFVRAAEVERLARLIEELLFRAGSQPSG